MEKGAGYLDTRELVDVPDEEGYLHGDVTGTVINNWKIEIYQLRW